MRKSIVLAVSLGLGVLLPGCSKPKGTELHVRTDAGDSMTCDFTTLKVYEELEGWNELDGYSIRRIGADHVGVIFMSSEGLPALETKSLLRFSEAEDFSRLQSISVSLDRGDDHALIFQREESP